MEKSIFSAQYKCLLERLRERRRAAGMTQAQLAARLQQTQSFVSKCERGERRLDVVELGAFCRAIGIDFVQFVASLEKDTDVAGR